MTTVPLHHEFTGRPDGPVLLLPNSLGTVSRQLWAHQHAELSERFRLLHVDIRGHNGSPAPPGPYSIDVLGQDVIGLLDSLGLGRVRFAGVSIGGMIGLWLAANAPDRIERAVFCCTSAHLPPPEGWLERAAAVRSSGTGAVAATATGRWFTTSFAHAHPETAAAFAETVAATDDEGYAACCEAIAAMDLRPDLPRITVPTLVIAAEDDPATPPAHAEAIAAAVPHARGVLVPGAHLANVESPAPVNAALLAHLEGA